MTDLEKLSFYLQEEQFPYFSENDLNNLLEEYPNVLEATYEGCLIKSSNDSVALGPIETPSNENYWIRRAAHFKRKLDLQNRKSNSKSGSSCIMMKRVDEF